ncbi:hypothetical protein KC316_g89 [Hortaea werneckii]|nr:hypothetical protein KC316_g89 [Hortaea werneckii]
MLDLRYQREAELEISTLSRPLLEYFLRLLIGEGERLPRRPFGTAIWSFAAFAWDEQSRTAVALNEVIGRHTVSGEKGSCKPGWPP